MMGAANWIRFGFVAFFTLIALFCFASEVLGLFKWKTMLCRMHAGAVGDTLGLFSAIAAAAIARGVSFDTLKMAAVALVMLVSSPTASHLLSQLECTVSGRGRDYYAPVAEDEGGEAK